jgi:hypothetical protein
VAARQGRLDVLKLAARGPQGQELTIDIGWFGAADPQRILVHFSGLRGIEGFAGSAIQLRCLDEGMPALPGDAARIDLQQRLSVASRITNPAYPIGEGGTSWLKC